ncbi:trigger factor [Mitsuokella jalaludinii]|uniref:Trigger factor n=4 Tax=Mitsuokella jalaludinii TaxID=187979 RepID=A0A173XRW5_9FIRM|nr:trigger factor [Mitsuokella jalaludinii]MCI7184791.1 trigger factor [Mitsuokella jalaludinii]MCI7716688.1 trigger factor [Mitsuokella jalaludinii]MCQ1533162.1 trigger factor [Mitsuokella jalaludinii]MDD7744787.1 trigger factor [Mitsuokella jalaludinii]MDY5363905.1 trigger factor [Mitsuokella jalaludinii]
MKVTVENGENQQVTLTIEVEAAEVNKAVDQACKRLANRVSIPGFRKGKAPRMIVERHVGKDAVLQEAFDIVAPKALSKAFDEQKIDPVTRPSVDIETLEEGKDLVFKATVTPRPEVKLGDYKGLNVPKNEVNITDEDVEKQLKTFQDRQGKLVDAPEGAEVKDGDFTTLDFKGFVDGEAFDGGEGKDYPLQIGSNSFIPGFEDQLVGAKIGEERDVNVKFPEEYHAKELAGKDATFKCTIRSIKTKELPAIDDELAKKVSKFETLDELKADIRKNLEENAERTAENDQKSAAIEMATNNITVDIPAVMIDNRVTAMIQEMAMRLEQQGMKLEQYLQYAGTDIAKLREQYRETAEKNVKTDLMLEEVAKAEDIKVEAKDLDEEVAAMAAAYGATPQQVQKIIKEQGRIGDLAASVLRKKTAQFIIDNIAK